MLSQDLKELDPNSKELEELYLLDVLPVALKKKEPEFPQLLEIRTRKNFHPDFKHLKEKSKEDKPKDEVKDPTAKEGELKEEKELEKVYSFITENKYVIEAIFENVLLENGMYRFPLSRMSESEKKQLMEKMLCNEEFKEYVYQKIIKSQDEVTPADPKDAAEHMMSAVTQDN